MNQEDYNYAMVAAEFANTAVAAADSKAARKHASDEAVKSREWQEKMYDRQLDDNIAWRTHQEAYNSPEAQMARYRDAGINPMYAVTGNGGNSIVTPNSTSVPMTNKADTPAPRNLRFNPQVLAQSAITKAQVKSINAQANMYNAQANEANTRAEGLSSENVGKKYEADVINELRKVCIDIDGGDYLEPMHKAEAWIRAYKRQYEYQYQGMSFRDAKAQFEHNKAVRKFEVSLNEHKKKLFQHELSQAKSAAQVFRVSAKWAIANQWINAGAEMLGASASLFGAFKGTSMMPTTSRNYSESYGDFTNRNIR